MKLKLINFLTITLMVFAVAVLMLSSCAGAYALASLMTDIVLLA